MGIVAKANHIYESLKEGLQEEVRRHNPGVVASVVIGEHYSSRVYLTVQKKLADELGIDYLSVALKEYVGPSEVIEKIRELNNQEHITGIVVNKPFPSSWQEEDIFCAIDARKDIEGMNPFNLGRLFIGNPLFVSPTVLSVLEFLKQSNVQLYGKEVTLVGFSTLIGKPLAILLGKEFATVTITHIGTYQEGRLPYYVQSADIVISAAGVPELIKGAWIKEGAIVIDVGVGEKEGVLCGDVEFAAAKEKASFITPVPGGVGKLTPLFLFRNLIQARDYK